MTPAQMARLHAAAFTDSRPWSEVEFAGLCASPTVFHLGDTRCFVLVRVIVDEAELLTIATDPAHRRRGLAQDLMQSWTQAAATRGARTAFLEVAANNAGAIALYLRCGFVENGRRKGYYARTDAGRVDALLFARDLTDREMS